VSYVSKRVLSVSSVLAVIVGGAGSIDYFLAMG